MDLFFGFKKHWDFTQLANSQFLTNPGGRESPKNPSDFLAHDHADNRDSRSSSLKIRQSGFPGKKGWILYFSPFSVVFGCGNLLQTLIMHQRDCMDWKMSKALLHWETFSHKPQTIGSLIIKRQLFAQHTKHSQVFWHDWKVSFSLYLSDYILSYWIEGSSGVIYRFKKIS